MNSLNKTLSHYLVFLGALFLIAMSINFFFSPHNIAAGGATGLAILAQELFGWPLFLTTLGVNIIMLILAAIFLARETVLRILFGSFMLPVMLAIIPQTKVVNDTLFAVIVGSAIFAAGIALLYNIDASSGGTTVPPLIFKKYFNLKAPVGLLIIDICVSFGNIFTAGLEAFVYAVFSIVITSLIMNYIESGFNRKKTLFISSNISTTELKDALGHDLSYGLTVIPSRGGFQDSEQELLMIVVDTQDYPRFVRKVLAADPDVFITVSDTASVHGGFFNRQQI
ncbi:YitT family protein [Convivina intestini]|uniref:YitT family protein n=1 Tax=Convivina intestini TaxID=1505726 RepID=UPI0030B82109